VCGQAESLPYADAQFDMVIARVSLVYTDLTASLAEIRRVLKKGGTVWMVLHHISVPWALARSGNWKNRVFFAYIVVNSIFFHLTRKQFSFRGKYESFQTRGGISRALSKSGFRNISIDTTKGFVVAAEAC